MTAGKAYDITAAASLLKDVADNLGVKNWFIAQDWLADVHGLPKSWTQRCQRY